MGCIRRSYQSFDFIHHALLYSLLKKIGVQDNLIKGVKNLYRYFKIEIKISKLKRLIDYRTGVKQGDNMVPIQFIIVMHFMSELIEIFLKSLSVEK